MQLTSIVCTTFDLHCKHLYYALPFQLSNVSEVNCLAPAIHNNHCQAADLVNMAVRLSQ